MKLFSFHSLAAILYFTVAIILMLLAAKPAHAASLASASATVSTSRPSPSSPDNDSGSPAGAAAGSGQLTIYNNGSRFLASDSARVIRANGTSITNVNLNVASQSGALTTVYFTNTTSTFVGNGADVLFVPITAMHAIRFTTATSIPSGGKIVITYPGLANNTASPSATTFAFNNLSTSNVVSNPAAGCNTVSISAPVITCTTNAIISGGTVVTVLIGCSAQSGGSCTTQVPSLINPTKSATAGTADIWRVGVQTQDGSSVVLDSSTIAIGTVESVTVRATIDPSLSFTIAGVNNGTLLSGVATGCSQADTTNSGISSTATEVGLGSLSVVPTSNDIRINNIAGQLLTVSTNASNGYSVTATSSGRLINPSTGFFINSVTTPIAFPLGGHFFGMHACGFDTNIPYWNSTGSTACNTYRSGSTDPVCKYGWPTSTSPILVAQNNTGVIGNGAPCFASGCGLTVVSYAATQDVSLPPGNYQSVITYVATPSF